MKKLISLLLSCVLTLPLSGSFPLVTSAADTKSNWAAATIDAAINLELVPEHMQGAYTAPATREEFCDTLILVLRKVNAGLADTDTAVPFTDTQNENVAALYSLGIVMGIGDGLFNPGGGISRQEAAVMLTRTAKLLGKNNLYTAAAFEDSALAADWAIESIRYAAGASIMQGTGIGFDPLGAYTREQTIATIYRLYNLVYTMKIPSPSKKDLDSSWDTNAAAITLRDTEITAEGSGVSVSGKTATITAAGTYVVSGTLTDGQIQVNTAKNDHVRLVLNGASITNKSGAPIYAASCDKLVVILADGTENILTDGGDSFIYADEAEKEPNAALFCKDDLSINGAGSLTVNAGFNNGIGTKDDLVIISGSITVTAKNHGLRGNDSISVYGGMLTIDAGADGLQTSNTDEPEKGWLYIADGTFKIKAANDGIQSEKDMTITGGSFTITTGGGSGAASVQQDGFGGNRQPGQSPQAEDTVSIKGIKTAKQLTLTGGAFTIDAEDDALHANESILITGGTFHIKTGDDGIHADNAVEISGGEITVAKSYEGIEGLSVTISGGDISVIASDDGINSAGGDDGEMFGGVRPQGGAAGLPQDWQQGTPQEDRPQRPQGGQWPQEGQAGGGMNEPRFQATEGAFIRISGGTIDIFSAVDGIDSNGDLTIEGGTVKVSGSSMGAEGAIDLDGKFMITGGELITAGSVYTASEDSTQALLLVSYNAQQQAGSIITLKDAKGNTVLEYTSKTAYSASGFTSPSFKQGETYTLFIDNKKRLDITISGLVTSIGDDGGAYNIGMGGGRGQRGTISGRTQAQAGI